MVSERARRIRVAEYYAVEGIKRPRVVLLRAESFSCSDEIEKLDEGLADRRHDSYGAILHEQSHGESLWSIGMHRFGGNGFICWTSRKRR